MKIYELLDSSIFVVPAHPSDEWKMSRMAQLATDKPVNGAYISVDGVVKQIEKISPIHFYFNVRRFSLRLEWYNYFCHYDASVRRMLASLGYKSVAAFYNQHLVQLPVQNGEIQISFYLCVTCNIDDYTKRLMLF